jgi:hypothetical protein
MILAYLPNMKMLVPLLRVSRQVKTLTEQYTCLRPNPRWVLTMGWPSKVTEPVVRVSAAMFACVWLADHIIYRNTYIS